ncbi:uncharacterized protein M6B38_306115 [Iris pallida]|uniref:Uncharacterized protein n=1 Tax=Iris pallida TaxID=29817 RepID=A0AAX6HK59_IRIPA|nr:uncharacterized protein M6B38_306115 [Iris pallida]
MSSRLSKGFSFFRSSGGSDVDNKGDSPSKHGVLPSLKLKTDKEIYRPGDLVVITVEISSTEVSKPSGQSSDAVPSVLVDNLGFEIKGVEKLDPQWFSTQKLQPGSKQRRGERLFLECSAQSIISKVILSSGSTKTYMVRAELPKNLPPSYRGTAIRYIYYARSTLHGRWLVLENGHRDKESNDELIRLEARVSLQIWVTQQSNNLLSEGALPTEASQMDIFWKEKDADCEWVRANDISDELEEGYDSSRDEVSSVSSFNPARRSADMSLKSSLSLQSMVTRASNSESQYPQGDSTSFPTYIPLSQLSVAETIDNQSEGLVSPMKKYRSVVSPKLQRKISNMNQTDKTAPPLHGPVEPITSEGFIRGRSYNIRIDDQVLLRFSPGNSDSTYYFGDMIGGTLTFFHGEGARRCLEVSVTLETSEIISQRFVHPSRRRSLTITKWLGMNIHFLLRRERGEIGFFQLLCMHPHHARKLHTQEMRITCLLEVFGSALERYKHLLHIVDEEGSLRSSGYCVRVPFALQLCHRAVDKMRITWFVSWEVCGSVLESSPFELPGSYFLVPSFPTTRSCKIVNYV